MPAGDLEHGRRERGESQWPTPGWWTLKQQAIALVQIERNDELRLSLAAWEEGFRVATSRIERKEAVANQIKNEVYQLIGFFILFQGVILTTLSQSSKLRCENWWFPFALSAITTVVILGGVVLKSFEYFKWRNGARREQRTAKVIHKFKDREVLKGRINYLKGYGKNFDFVKHGGDTGTLKRTKVKVKTLIIAGIFLFLVFSLIGFAAIVLVACRVILCPP